jgi:hypothetical protein
MPTEFSYEHVFRAPSTTTILEAYFDPDHLATQDKAAELSEREVMETREDDAVKVCTWSVRSLRPLPAFVRPFVEGGRLRYLETMTWRKADNEIDMTITPQIANGRVQITAVYSLSQVAENQVRRRYQGSIKVNASILSGKIERAILGEMEKGMPSMKDCTQSWLLARSTP